MRLAIVTTHPIQYYAPWFRWIAANTDWTIKVFYLWDSGLEARRDPGFGRSVQWDLPLLEGYDHEFVPNASRHPSTTRFGGLRNPELLLRLNRFQPDAGLVIGYKYWSLFRLIFASRRRRPFPLIFRGDSHRLGEMRNAECGMPNRSERTLKFRVRRWAIAQVYRRFAAVLYVGNANREYFRLHGVPERKLFFSPHAVDNQRFMESIPAAEEEATRWRAELGISVTDLVILFAGKFEAKKRPLDLLEAFSRINRPNVSLLFVGNGELEEELKRRAGALPKVFFAPFQNQSRMPTVYATGNLLVLPSYGPEESWGLAVNEAFCLRRPVIVSHHVGCGPDLVEPGQTGLIFAAGDVQALSAALSEALSDRTRLLVWGRSALRKVLEYDYEHATEGLSRAFSLATETTR